jgi:hypothetical protein
MDIELLTPALRAVITPDNFVAVLSETDYVNHLTVAQRMLRKAKMPFQQSVIDFAAAKGWDERRARMVLLQIVEEMGWTLDIEGLVESTTKGFRKHTDAVRAVRSTFNRICEQVGISTTANVDAQGNVTLYLDAGDFQRLVWLLAANA